MPVEEQTTQFKQAMIAMISCLLLASIWYFIPHPAIAAIAILPVLVVLTLRLPFLVCLGFIVFSFFRLHEVFPAIYPLRIPQLLALGTLASLSINLVTKRLPMFWSKELSTFGLFFCLVVIGAFMASNRGEAMAALTGTYIKIAIMVLAIAWLVKEEGQFKFLHLAMVICGACVGLVALYNKSMGLELVEETRVTIGRSIGSMLGDPNDLSLVLLFPTSFAGALFLTPGYSRLLRLLGLIVFCVVIAAIIATQSRGGLLGICAVTGIFAWRRVENKFLLISAGICALMLLMVLAGVSDRASGGSHEEGIDESAMGRIYAWQAAFGMALHNPFTGVGIDNFLSNYYAYSPHWDGQNHSVHSTWFGVLAETGFIGLIIFICLIVQIARIGMQSIKRFSPEESGEHYSPVLYANAQALEAGLAGFCISGTFLTMGFTWPIYILLAIAVATSQYQLIPSTSKPSFPRFKNQPAPESKLSRNTPRKLREKQNNKVKSQKKNVK